MNAIKRNSIKIIGITLLLFAYIAGAFLFELYHVKNINTAYKALTDSAKDVVGEISKNVTIEQELPYHVGDTGVSVEFATYARENKGKVTISIVGEQTGFVYANLTKAAKKFKDNSYIDIAYEDNRPNEDETLKMLITSTSKEGSAITVYTTDYDSLPGYSFVVNGEERSVDVVTRSIIPSRKENYAYFILALILICFVLTMGAVVYKRTNMLAKAFFITALSLGMIYNFVMTPLSIPDEHYHYQSAFRLSNVLCFQWNDLETADGRYFDFHDVSIHNNVGSAYDRLAYEILAPLPEEQGETFHLGGSLEYPPMLIPQAIGVTIGRILGANFIVTFYLGRITNLLFYIGCVYFAIKKAPRYNLLFFLIGIMPMSLHQAASYSYDAFIDGMALLLLSYIIRAIDGKGPIQFKELLPIAIVGALLAPAKIVYTPLLLLVFLIPVKRFPSKGKYYLHIFTILFCAALLVIVFQFKQMLKVSTSGGAELNWEGGVNYSIKDIIQEPVKMANIYFGTFNALIWSWYLNCMGLMMSGLTLPIENWAIILYGVLLLLAAFSYTGQKTTSDKERCLYITVGFATILMTMLVFLLSYTSNTRDLIPGIQGRYFIPILPLFYMSCNNPYIRINKPVEKNIIILAMLINVSVLRMAFFATI